MTACLNTLPECFFPPLWTLESLRKLKWTTSKKNKLLTLPMKKKNVSDNKTFSYQFPQCF